MSKKVSIFLILILLSIIVPIVLSEVANTYPKMNVNQTVKLAGKSFTIVSINPFMELKVDVDGVKGIIKKQGREEYVNGMFVNLSNLTYYIDETYIEAVMNLRVPHVCGDKKCESNDSETMESCCTDCGCPQNFECIDNQCYERGCLRPSHCDDNNSCTIDTCVGIPLNCAYEDILKCTDNDSCCPGDCTYENDTDCKAPEGKCFSDAHCDDGNICTSDICDNSIRDCTNKIIGICIKDDHCYPVGKIISSEYCIDDGNWLVQKGPGETCSYDYECDNKNCDGVCQGATKLEESKQKIFIVVLIVIALVAFFIIRRRYKYHTEGDVGDYEEDEDE